MRNSLKVLIAAFALTTTGNGEFDHVDLVSASIVWRFR